MKTIEEAIKVAWENYNEETFYHAMRVAAYVTKDNLIPDDKKKTCVILAILHDLLEDTNFDKNTLCLDYKLKQCLNLITKNKKNTYEDYLKNIKANYNSYPEVYWVKLSDMRDHLTRTDTLTDKLKEKYLSAIPCLL